MGFNSPDPARTPVSTAYHVRERRQSFALGGGQSSGRVGSSVDYLNNRTGYNEPRHYGQAIRCVNVSPHNRGVESVLDLNARS
jgi:hypothetical protein